MIYTKIVLHAALVIVFIVVMSTTVGLSQTFSKGLKETGNVIHQLRIYEIFDNNKTAFHERFRDHAMRIMARYGFKIVATCESRHDNRTEFVYSHLAPRYVNIKSLRLQEWLKAGDIQ